MHRFVAYIALLLAYLFGAGSLVLFARVPPGSLGWMPSGWPEGEVLAWDAGLCLAFFVQHSVMVRRGFRARIAAVIPEYLHRAVYAIASGVVLSGMVVFWQPSATLVLTFPGPIRIIQQCAVWVAVIVFLWGALALRGFDGFGARQIRSHLKGIVETSSEFVVRGPYRWVRHPWYLSVLLLIWSKPSLSADGVLFNVLWTTWIVMGTYLEERDLVAEFGEPYREYRRRVPMLIPWRVGGFGRRREGVAA